MSRKKVQYTVEDFYFLKVGPLWRYFWSEHPAFWFICGYLFIEYFRPQSIYPAIDILPWAQVFLLGALGASFFDKKSSFYWTWTHTWVILFTLQIYLSFLFAYDVSWSKFYAINFYQWIIIFFVVTKVVTTKERFYILFLVFFLCSLKIAVGTSRTFAMRGFGFTSWGLQGPSGYFQNSGELAIQMVILFCISIYLVKTLWARSGNAQKVLLLISLFTPVLTVIGASSRGGQIALVLVLVIYFNLKILKPKILIAAATIFYLIFLLIPEEQKVRFESMGDDNTSEQRILYWTNGYEMIKEHPLFGVGYYNFIPYYSDNYPDDVLFVNPRGEKIAELPHNILVQIGTDAGIPAIIFYIALSISQFIFSKKSDANDYDAVSFGIYKGLCLGIIGYWIAGQFVTVTYYPFLWISVALIVSFKHAFVYQEIKKNQRALTLC